MLVSIDELANDLSQSNIGISPAEFKDYLLQCEIWLYQWGAIFVNKNEMHIHIMKPYRKKVYLRKELRKIAKIMFERYETLKTSVAKTKPESMQFNAKMGWKIVNETPVKWNLEAKKEDFKYV